MDLTRQVDQSINVLFEILPDLIEACKNSRQDKVKFDNVINTTRRIVEVQLVLMEIQQGLIKGDNPSSAHPH